MCLRYPTSALHKANSFDSDGFIHNKKQIPKCLDGGLYALQWCQLQCLNSVLHLPGEKVCPASKNVAPSTQKNHLLHLVLRLPHKEARHPATTIDHRQLAGSPSGAHATLKQQLVHRVLHLPSTRPAPPAATIPNWQCSSLQSAAAATQAATGAPSASPAMQKIYAFLAATVV